MKFVFDGVENSVAKGEDASNHCNLLFQQCIKKPLSTGSTVIKTSDFVVNASADLTLYSIDTHFYASTMDSF